MESSGVFREYVFNIVFVLILTVFVLTYGFCMNQCRQENN